MPTPSASSGSPGSSGSMTADASAGAPASGVGELSYEDARDELVRVVNELERGASTLEQSLALWERGEALAARCEEWLIGAKTRLDAARATAGAGSSTTGSEHRGRGVGASRVSSDSTGGPASPAPAGPHRPGRAKPGRVVAELGRPETEDETAARKAEQSRKYRANKTVNNLWLSLIVCVGVVIVLVFLVPHDDSSRLQTVDYRSLATSAEASLPVPLASPDLPSTWTANAAEIRTGDDKIAYWYIGFVTPATTFIGIDQAVGANEAWLSTQLHDTIASGTVTIDGVQWTIYDNRKATQDVGNAQYALTTTSGASTYVLFGNASTDDFQTVAQAIAANVQSQPAATAVTTGGRLVSAFDLDAASTPAEVWADMIAGNERFVQGAPEHPRQDVDRRHQLATGQTPRAALFGCSDSRLAAEIIFDKGLGDLFVVRNAGQVISDSVIGSLEYAVGVLGVQLIVVLGHDACGAVQAAITSQGPDAPALPPHIDKLIGKIVPAVTEVRRRSPDAPIDAYEVGRFHLRDTVAELLESSEMISDAIAAGQLAIVGANYRLDEGRAVPDLVVGSIATGVPENPQSAIPEPANELAETN